MHVPVPRIERVARNRLGRDFVVGDVHGCFRTLEQCLAKVRFDPERDRLFSVGDLVNRGPHSLEAVEWLTDGRIAGAVAGNHEIWTLATLVNGRYLLGGDWRAEIRDQDLVRWMVALEELPLAIEVETLHGAVGIVHAGVVNRSWLETAKGIKYSTSKVIAVALLGQERDGWDGKPRTEVEGLKALVTGHEPFRAPQTDGHWWRIDTGAGYWTNGHMTLLRIDPKPIEWVSVPVREYLGSAGSTAGK